MADPENGVLALLDILHQLDRGGESLFHVISHVAVGRVARQQAAVGGVQPKLRQVVVVHENLPFAIHFAELNVRLDKPRLGFVVAQAGLRIEALDHVHGALHELDRAIERPRDIFELVILQKLQMLADDLLRERVLRIEHFELQQQAFLQVARGHSRRIEFLHHGERFFHVFHGVISGCAISSRVAVR